ncbi:hypothetical protein [Streptomyces sp. NPDC000395]|uniref:hypothetical protein n=2 Tax=unclassified Streptomyces TaxID=2593676 RepID=UPI00336A6914
MWGRVDDRAAPRAWHDDPHAAAAGSLPRRPHSRRDGHGGLQSGVPAAKEQDAVFVAIESLGEHWTVKADMITAPQHAVADSVYDAVRAAVIQLLRAGEIRSDSSAGPVYFVLHDVAEEGRACELAAALHAALYGNLAPLARAMPTAS